MSSRRADTIMNLVMGIALALILVGVECPVADSITTGLVLMIALILIDVQGERSQ